MTKPFIGTGMIRAALGAAELPPASVELRDPGLSADDREKPDIIRLKDNYYLGVEVFDPNTPMKFSVSLNESMHSGGDVQHQSWVIDGMRAESVTPIIEAVKSL